MFYNISNHPSQRWTSEQLNVALEMGKEIKDIPFPNVDPEDSSLEIQNLADDVMSQLDLNSQNVYHVMGEMTLVFALVSRLKSLDMNVVASTTKRESTENPDGSKTVFFRFTQFRKY